MSTAIWPRSERMRSRIPRIWCGSRPMVGSSKMTTLGWAKSASAMPTRWRKPLESWPMRRPEARRTRSQSSITWLTRPSTLPASTSLRRARRRRYSSTRRSSGSGLFSGIYAMWRLASAGLSATETPQMEAQPDVPAIVPERIRMVVDLPAPFGPRKPTTSPGATENVRSSIAVSEP